MQVLTFITAQIKLRGVFSSRLEQKEKNAPPTKKKDMKLYWNFTMNNMPGGRVSASCNHCSEWNNKYVQVFNAAKAHGHLVNEYAGITQELRHELAIGSPTRRARDKVFPLLCGPVASMVDMHSATVSGPLIQSIAGNVSSVGPLGPGNVSSVGSSGCRHTHWPFSVTLPDSSTARAR